MITLQHPRDYKKNLKPITKNLSQNKNEIQYF
jgi:hypothetical protein